MGNFLASGPGKLDNLENMTDGAAEEKPQRHRGTQRTQRQILCSKYDHVGRQTRRRFAGAR